MSRSFYRYRVGHRIIGAGYESLIQASEAAVTHAVHLYQTHPDGHVAIERYWPQSSRPTEVSAVYQAGPSEISVRSRRSMEGR